MLSVLNKLTLVQGIAKVCDKKGVFWTKVKTQQQQNNQTLKPLPEPGIEPGTSCTQSGCVTTAPPSQLRVLIVVQLFNCFDAMGRNVNKQSRICRPHIFNKFMFSVIFLHA